MKNKKTWRKVVQKLISLMLIITLAYPMPVIAQTENTVKDEELEQKKTATDSDIQLTDTKETENTVKDEELEQKKKATDSDIQLTDDEETENTVKDVPEELDGSINAQMNSLSIDPQTVITDLDNEIQALISALGGSEYAETSGSYSVQLKKSVTISSGTLTIPSGIELQVNIDTNGTPVTLTLEESTALVIEQGGYVSLSQGGFLKVDSTISGGNECISLSAGSSISSTEPLSFTLFATRVVSCTDWQGERTVYAPMPIDIGADIEPEGFIIKADGRGTVYESLGLNFGSAFDMSESGDTIYLLKDFITTDTEENDFEKLINNPLKGGVTLVIKRGQTFNVGILSLFCMVFGTDEFAGEGSIIALAGSQCIMPWSKLDERTPFIGTTDDAMMLLELGAVKVQLPRANAMTPLMSVFEVGAKQFFNANGNEKAPAEAIFLENSRATIAEPLTLRVMNDAMNCVMKRNSTITVASVLALDGNTEFDGKRPGVLTLEEGAVLQTTGIGAIFLDTATITNLEEGSTFSAQYLDGFADLKDKDPGYKAYLQGTIVAKKGAAVKLQDTMLLGGDDAYISIKEGTAKLNLAPEKRINFTSGTEAVLNEDFEYKLVSTVSNNGVHENFLNNLTLEQGSTFTINATLTMPSGSVLNSAGTIIIGANGVLDLQDGSTFVNTGKVIVQPGGKINSANSIELNPFVKKVFRSETVGYTNPESLTVTVKNSGSQATEKIKLFISGDDSDDFTLSTSEIESLPTEAENTFTVTPKTGLTRGSYTAQVNVSNGNIIMTFPISFTVTRSSSGGNRPKPETDDKPTTDENQPTPDVNDPVPENQQTPETGDPVLDNNQQTPEINNNVPSIIPPAPGTNDSTSDVNQSIQGNDSQDTDKNQQTPEINESDPDKNKPAQDNDDPASDEKQPETDNSNTNMPMIFVLLMVLLFGGIGVVVYGRKRKK